MKLPKFLFDKVKVHNTSLGDNAAFPPEEDYPFDYKILKKRFNDICEELQHIGVETTDENELKTYLGKLLERCKEIEEPIRPYLIKICKNWVNKQLAIPDETIILECELVNKVSPKNSVRLMPEESDFRNFDFNDINDFDNVKKVIMKRRLINSLIQGVSHNCNKYGDLNSELSELNKELPHLYHEISVINDYLLFMKEEKITDKNPSQGSCVEVMLGSGGNKTEIYVQGLIFPYLLQETFRGFFELFASHGLPQDNDKAMYIVKQADFLLAEPWDIRMGVGLWEILSEKIDDPRILPYFFTTLCELPVDEFNENIREAFAKTKRGKAFIKELINDSMYYVRQNSFIDVEPLKNDDAAVLNDSYISSEELDDYVIEESDEEDVNHNDEIELIKQELISCDVESIDFKEEEYNIAGIQLTRGMWVLHVLVNGKEVPTELVFFRAEEIPPLKSYQLHINVDDSLKRKGIAFKLYQQFIKLFGTACSLFKNRVATFYDENNVLTSSDAAIDGLWKKIAQVDGIKVLPVRNKNKEIIGVKAILE